MALNVNGRELETDEEGFLLDPHDWNETIAQEIAEGEKLELTEPRWAVVRYVREHFDSHGAVPEARHILKVLGERFGKEKATRNTRQVSAGGIGSRFRARADSR